MKTRFGLGALGVHTWHMVDAADELRTVLFGYGRCSHVAVDIYSHWSRATDMDGRGSPLITADELNSLEVCGCIAPLNYVNLIVLTTILCWCCTFAIPKGKCYELPKMMSILHHSFH